MTRLKGYRWLLVLGLMLIAGPAAAADWEADWQATVANANKEGKLVLSVPSGRDWRDALMTFEKAYPAIAVEATPAASREFWPRVMKEREVGQYLWDLRIGGPDALSYGLKDQGVMEPVRPLLVLPEVVDGSKWMGGFDGLFLDKEKKYFPGFMIFDSNSLYYNKQSIPAGISMKDLDAAQWKGKISLADPRGGAGLVTLGIMDMVFGDDYVRRLLVDQAPVVTGEPRQQIDWLSFGRYPIAIGVPSAALLEYSQHGGRIDGFGLIAGLRMSSPGVGGIQMPNHMPHPNAAKVFVNWLLTHATQTQLVKAVALNSRRLDVPPGASESAVDADQLSQYIDGQAETVQPYQQKAVQILRETGK